MSITDVESATSNGSAPVVDGANVDGLVADCARSPLPGLPEGRDTFTIAEVAAHTGVTAHALRYYERIGLIDVPRDEAGRRRYTPDEVRRAVFITRLRTTEMPIRDIQAYFALVREGSGNEAERLELLERHRAGVVRRIEELSWALAVVDHKIGTYGGPSRA
ncbi:MAG: MerR family transcriptional regulator [Actinomycetota bacterium]|nr:MerR family transcriptional regulator [Actinomycetota bacterium]